MEKPYVISQELDILDAEYIQKESIEQFRESLDADLRNMGKNTVWVEAERLRAGLDERTSGTKLPVVSLDDRYITAADAQIGISRNVDITLNDCGYAPRAGYTSLSRQLDEAARLGDEVLLADDVVYSGEMIEELDAELCKRGTKIGAVACGILIGEGAERLEEIGIQIDPVEVFVEVDDELCERDFAVVQGSGRRIAELGANALYFCSEYGRPAQWASIPQESVGDFAASSYRRSAKLLCSGADISDIGAFYGLPTMGNAAELMQSKAQIIEGVN